MSPLIFTSSDLIYHPDSLLFRMVRNVFTRNRGIVIQLVFILSVAAKAGEAAVDT
jgi:hypothetical protein